MISGGFHNIRCTLAPGFVLSDFFYILTCTPVKLAVHDGVVAILKIKLIDVFRPAGATRGAPDPPSLKKDPTPVGGRGGKKSLTGVHIANFLGNL